MLDNATTVAKVGFYMEQHAEQLMVEVFPVPTSRPCSEDGTLPRPLSPRTRAVHGILEPHSAGADTQPNLGGNPMRLSIEHLTAEATATGFRPEMLEKVIHLLGLLEGFSPHPFDRT